MDACKTCVMRPRAHRFDSFVALIISPYRLGSIKKYCLWPTILSLLFSCVIENSLCRRRPNAADPESAHRQQALQSADAAGGFHLHMRRRMATHEPQIVVDGAGAAVP